MRIALLHYHLKPGGVTTVIRHQVDALKEDCEILLLSGEPPCPAWPVPFKHIPGIGYQSEAVPDIDPHKVAREIYQAIQDQWKGGCDLLHVHNPTLAKNRALLAILKALQDRGVPLFLQIHDFAEDGRPHAYFQDEYPRDCHYGVINSRDYHVLLKAGLKREGLHTISNPVRPLGIAHPSSLGDPDILYPVRAIRRKNIGEALLLSLYFKEGQALSITLPPNSPADIAAYSGWKKFSLKHKLNIRFESGLGNEFKQLVSRSRSILTTSITEGFGYAFLEAWTAGKLLWGRNLADITRDFTRRGVRLDHLYRHLLVPLSWMDHHLFFTRWKNCVLENSTPFGLGLQEKSIDHAAQKMIAAGRIDFGLLDEFFQKQLLHVLLSDPGKKDRLAEINPFLKSPVLPDGAQKLITHNRQRVLDKFNAAVYRKNLLKTFQTVLRSPVKQRIDKHCLAASFFDLDAFSMLKWGRYVE